jgi:NAD(P)-dependent dehydrogenase (short-subunit alcohol dehydrogenase family)
MEDPKIAAHAKVALITGGSMGIGKMCAEHLAASGWKVFTASRGTTATSELNARIEHIRMDVNDDASVRAGVLKVVEMTGRLDAVINNAGFALLGAVEDTEISEAKAVFETNFFGALRVCRAALPALRTSHGGYIINISSLGGIVGLPFGGLYSASKFAIEGMSESLRLEARQFGVHVVLVEPGDFHTQIMARRQIVASSKGSFYHEGLDKFLEKRIREEARAPSPEAVARLIERILADPNPKMRYSVGKWSQRVVIPLKRFLPQRIFERLFRAFMGL